MNLNEIAEHLSWHAEDKENYTELQRLALQQAYDNINAVIAEKKMDSPTKKWQATKPRKIPPTKSTPAIPSKKKKMFKMGSQQNLVTRRKPKLPDRPPGSPHGPPLEKPIISQKKPIKSIGRTRSNSMPSASSLDSYDPRRLDIFKRKRAEQIRQQEKINEQRKKESRKVISTSQPGSPKQNRSQTLPDARPAQTQLRQSPHRSPRGPPRPPPPPVPPLPPIRESRSNTDPGGRSPHVSVYIAEISHNIETLSTPTPEPILYEDNDKVPQSYADMEDWETYDAPAYSPGFNKSYSSPVYVSSRDPGSMSPTLQDVANSQKVAGLKHKFSMIDKNVPENERRKPMNNFPAKHNKNRFRNQKQRGALRNLKAFPNKRKSKSFNLGTNRKGVAAMINVCEARDGGASQKASKPKKKTNFEKTRAKFQR